MSLVACHECGKEVSTEAKTCPSCGAKVQKPKKKTSRATLVVAVVVGLGAVMAVSESAKKTNERPPLTEAEKRANDARDRQLQLAGGVALSLKKAAKDPTVFELTSALVHSDGAACYEYRAKNSFGAILPGEAVLSTNGKVLVRELDGTAFTAAWRKLCTRSGGDDIAPLMKRRGMI